MPVIDEVLSDYFKKYDIPKDAAVGVAVSGGADSLCLALHLSKITKRYGQKLSAATVNHGLRPESADEAQQVKTLMGKWDVPHTTLHWGGKKPKTHIEEKAREKRYELLLNWCRDNHIQYLFLAHHAGDQAETFWARLARGSGIDGLGSMSPKSERDGIFLCRPFLNLDKKALKNDLCQYRILWAEDSMNDDESYERVRWRHQQKIFDKMGLNLTVIGRTAKRLQRAKEALDFYATRFQSALVDMMPQGYAVISKQAFLSVPEEIRLRVLDKTITAVSGCKAPISMDALEQWLANHPKCATIAGCLLVESKGLLFICREKKKMNQNISVPAHTLTHWNQFLILSSDPIRISLGCNDKILPYIVRQSIPAVQSHKKLSITFIMTSQKELEKKFAVDYKKKQSGVVYIAFEKGLK